jgi:hypothetical protein
MRHEAIDTQNEPAPSSVTLGNWLMLVRLSGIKTPLDQLSNKEVDLILARVSELAGEKETPRILEGRKE